VNLLAKSKERICRAIYNVLTRVVLVEDLKRLRERSGAIDFHMEKINLMIEANREFIRYCASTMEKLDYDAIPHIEDDLEGFIQAKKNRLTNRFSRD